MTRARCADTTRKQVNAECRIQIELALLDFVGIGCVGLLLHDPTLLPAQNLHDSRQKSM